VGLSAYSQRCKRLAMRIAAMAAAMPPRMSMP